MTVKSLIQKTLITLSVLSFNSLAMSESLMDAITDGKPSVQLRLSYEMSDLKDNGLDKANGINLRTRLGFKTAPVFNSYLFLQGHNLTAMLDEYRPEDTEFDVIADPEATRLHQGYLGIMLEDTGELKLGRQEINLGGQRFIGAVDWRQNGQSFDAALFDLKAITDTTLSFAYIWQVNTILDTEIDLDHLVLIHGTNKSIENVTIQAYAYLLDTESTLPTAQDKATYGLSFDGTIGGVKYYAEYAMQDSYQDSEIDGGDYVHIYGSYNLNPVTLGLGYEMISGASGSERAFDTLYSTAHKFNGWSDQFLATNGGGLAAGIEDLYGEIATSILGCKVLFRFHDFAKESIDGDYGQESELQVMKKFSEQISLLVKLAVYEADSENLAGAGSLDETLFVTRLEYKY